jgi:hypothetical protein
MTVAVVLLGVLGRGLVVNSVIVSSRYEPIVKVHLTLSNTNYWRYAHDSFSTL